MVDDDEPVNCKNGEPVSNGYAHEDAQAAGDSHDDEVEDTNVDTAGHVNGEVNCKDIHEQEKQPVNNDNNNAADAMNGETVEPLNEECSGE